MALALNNAQGELSPLEIGLHALRTHHTIGRTVMANRTARAASDSAWSTYLLLHREVDENDDRRVALRVYVANLCDAGEQNPDALRTAGLVYLRKLDELAKLKEQLARYRTLQALKLR